MPFYACLCSSLHLNTRFLSTAPTRSRKTCDPGKVYEEVEGDLKFYQNYIVKTVPTNFQQPLPGQPHQWTVETSFRSLQRHVNAYVR